MFSWLMADDMSLIFLAGLGENGCCSPLPSSFARLRGGDRGSSFCRRARALVSYMAETTIVIDIIMNNNNRMIMIITDGGSKKKKQDLTNNKKQLDQPRRFL